MENSDKQHIGGISAKAFVFPLWAVMTVLLASIVFLIIDVNKTSNQLFDLMERSGAYQLDAISMQASNTVMSETFGSYIQAPLNKDGEPNVGLLLTYAKELDADRSASSVLERFKQYKVSDEVFSYIENAAKLSDEISAVQMHAISLMSSVYKLPPIPELSKVTSVPLTPEEAAMPPEERVAYAKQLVLTYDYSQLRHNVAENVDNCNRTLQKEFSIASAKAKNHVATVRVLLWIAVALIILILGAAFRFLYISIIKPLIEYSGDISADRRIKRASGVFEMRQLSNSFNELLKNRNKLEAVLRAAAENDALTGLPNRYCLQRDMIKEENNGVAMAILLFDVNFLKKVNDTEGHLAGDNLLRTSADCIKNCFGEKDANNCYRIGGDEFVAVLSDCGEAEVRTKIDRFYAETKDKKITVSVGYAYTDNAENGSFDEMMAEADRNMYEHKRRIHEMYDAAESDA